MTSNYISNLARALLGRPYEALTQREQTVIAALAQGDTVAENVNQLFREQSTLGQRLADKLACGVGSWPFIISFLVLLVAWMGLNTFILANMGKQFDPYPYILLNLALSTLASIQAPIIMMSQNRQTEKDRIAFSNAFQVHLKTELAIEQLHGKMDQILARSGESPTRSQT